MAAGRWQRSSGSRDLAVVLHDLAWLLPRTVGVEASRQAPLPASELEVMRLLARHPGLSVNDVARELGMQASNVSTAVRSLVARGTLRREADDNDGRVVRLVPTDLAFADRERREETWGTSMSGVLDEFSAADRAQLIAAVPLLRLLADHLGGTAAASAAQVS